MFTARCRHLSPILTGFAFTTVGGASASVDKGSNDFPSASCASAGKVAATQAELSLFSRGPIVIGSPGDGVGDGGFACFDTLPASGVITAELLDKTGSGDDGTGYVIAMGFGNADTDRFDDAQIVRSTINAPQLLAWRIDNDGSASIVSGGSQASIARASTGIVTLTLSPARAQFRSAVAAPVNASARAARITSLSAEAITVKVTDKDGTVQDSDFIVFALVSGNSDESGRCLEPLKVPQLEPEFVCGRVTVTAGAPSVTIGGATNGVDFTVTDNGVGDYSIDLTSAFLRNCLPIPFAKDNRAQLIADPTTSGFRVGVFDASGAAADDSFDFILIGYNATSDQEF